ncbi:translation initiation factor IF-2-like [Motacilla alba alba]|uniref:translation initiation factor IF-2-like n=1 Tax=Motacilla alba alba TaxID=1094192 RepID=UPI0018D50ACD|nr:translation initiation factor IF-2-like [Motacilla alba alba]
MASSGVGERRVEIYSPQRAERPRKVRVGAPTPAVPARRGRAREAAGGTQERWGESAAEGTGHRAAALLPQRPFIYTAGSALPALPPMRIRRELRGRGPGRAGLGGGAPAAGASKREGAGGCGTGSGGKGGYGPPTAHRSSNPPGRAGLELQ